MNEQQQKNEIENTKLHTNWKLKDQQHSRMKKNGRKRNKLLQKKAMQGMLSSTASPLFARNIAHTVRQFVVRAEENSHFFAACVFVCIGEQLHDGIAVLFACAKYIVGFGCLSRISQYFSWRLCVRRAEEFASADGAIPYSRSYAVIFFPLVSFRPYLSFFWKMIACILLSLALIHSSDDTRCERIMRCHHYLNRSHLIHFIRAYSSVCVWESFCLSVSLMLFSFVVLAF